MISAHVGLGANLGDLRRTLEAALADLADVPDLRLEAVSSAWRSAPVGCEGPDYLNAVARVRTGLPPLTLLAALQAIELRHGRERPYVNAPRTLDLDLLLYGDQAIDLDRLTVPHPRLHQRAFVLRPLLELDPALAAPGLGPLADHLGAVAGQAIEREPAPLRLARGPS
ncbi:2-amino-4-hydroxy-6-hydroxymethyldihydropteridine diphosphokinase [Mitsuaria sp. GD03876]|uniref:2-amino-4-hydroxy-6- hydroxymethyldihydropteridine diphosphokinase n=1 Tax=Mitsuaria sp. GD03876 TaxID=2975399 RepID=UPI00244CEABA|nr:2-amino-4-hydroxy-6-hydroxymethyldihydropteridine diphosphokinase [Mitsuaria sp. GD03876]MDH0865999.1 2-amino-4-hydroxy-6-hydroxymethyldihydropteridine diphosphokinase [Mitsuaria sp. GD03876]